MRKITSLTLLISGFIEIITSVVLYIIPAGRVAYWSDYHLLGLDKHQWGNIHITVGTLFIVALALHVYYNWRPLMAYLKNKAKEFTLLNLNLIIALSISLYVTIGTLYSLPPMNYIITFGEYISNLGNKKYGEPPYGHAELSSLKMFCSRMNINLDSAVEILKKNGIQITDTKEPIGIIAKNNKKTAQQIYDLIKPATLSRPDENAAFPKNPPPGFGNQTIKTICQEYELDINDVITKLQESGFSVTQDDTVKEIAANNDSDPMAVFEIIQEIAGQGK